MIKIRLGRKRAHTIIPCLNQSLSDPHPIAEQPLRASDAPSFQWRFWLAAERTLRILVSLACRSGTQRA